MDYKVWVHKTALKNLKKVPDIVKRKFDFLLEDLKESGPIQLNWPGFSKLQRNQYHCHLNYRYVACWKNEKGSLFVEVYYAGPREKASY